MLSYTNFNFRFNFSHQSSTIDACTSLHEKWQQHHRLWFSSNLSDSENKLVVAEENWRRSRLSTSNIGSTSVSINGQSLDKSYPQRNLRDLMEELRSSSSQNKRNIHSSKSKSDYTAADFIASSESDLNENDDDDNFLSSNVQASSNPEHRLNNISMQPDLDYEKSGNPNSIRSHIAQRKKLPTPSPTAQVLGLSSNKNRSDSKSSLDDSLYSSLSNEVYSKINVSHENQSHHKSFVPETSKDSNCDQLFSPKAMSNKNNNKTPQTLRDRLKECALVSESGTASVIEVIEPTLSEEEEFQNSIREMSWNISINGSRTDKNLSQKSSHLPSPRSPLKQERLGNNSFFSSNGNLNSPISIFPSRNDERSSIITITSSNSNTARSSASSSSSYSLIGTSKKFGKGNNKNSSTVGKPNVVQSTIVDHNEDSSSNRYSTYSDISPTKRLLEMGITTDALNDNNNTELDENDGGMSQYSSLNNSNNPKYDTASSLKGSPTVYTVHNSATYVIKKKKPHPTAIHAGGYQSPSSSKNSSKITFTDLDFLQEHFVDDSFDNGDISILDQDGEKINSNKKTTFLQKIANKTKWNNMKKKMNTTNKESNIETTGYKQNSLNGSPLISQRHALNNRSHPEGEEDEGLEEHILPDSFEDLPGDPDTSGDIEAAGKDQGGLTFEQNNNGKTNNEKIEYNSERKSLSPSSRKSFLFSTSSNNNNSSTATMKSSSGISANSVASTSEDSGIGLIASSGSIKISDTKMITSNKPVAILNDISKSSLDLPFRSQKEMSLPSNPHHMDINGDGSWKKCDNSSSTDQVALSRIDEASSVASQSSKSCNSESFLQDKVSNVSPNTTNPYSTKDKVHKINEKNLLNNSDTPNLRDEVSILNKSYTPINSSNSANSKQTSITHLLEQPKLRRNFSNTKAWYDIPSDEDPEAPEADSLASIITHRSHSSEED